MRVRIVSDVQVHQVPCDTMAIDDASEQRWKARFGSWQALKVTTVDCHDLVPMNCAGVPPFHILEIIDSAWIEELKTTLKARDCTAHFMDESHHYVLWLGDHVVEVAAWNTWTLERI